MILSCEEVECKKLPMRKFFVTASCDMSPADILRLCGKVPELHDLWDGDNAEFNGWSCCNVSVIPESADWNSWWIKCDFKPPAVVIPDDEPTFPPYSGPVGKQPDGSFVLTPRCYHYLADMFAHKWNRIKFPDYHLEYIDKLQEVIEADCKTSFMELT